MEKHFLEIIVNPKSLTYECQRLEDEVEEGHDWVFDPSRQQNVMKSSFCSFSNLFSYFFNRYYRTILQYELLTFTHSCLLCLYEFSSKPKSWKEAELSMKPLLDAILFSVIRPLENSARFAQP